MVEILTLVVIAAAVVEFLTEGIKVAIPKAAGWAISVVLALALCISGRLTLLGTIGFTGMIWPVDAVLTALIISRGSSALHEFLKKIGVVKAGDGGGK